MIITLITSTIVLITFLAVTFTALAALHFNRRVFSPLKDRLVITIVASLIGLLLTGAVLFYYNGWSQFFTILYVAGVLAFLSVTVLALVWLERKVLARIQMRIGPMRVGFHGILQPIADGIKLLTKESLIPATSSRLLYFCAPLALFIPSFIVWMAIPFSSHLVVKEFELGLLLVLALSVVSIIGLMMAGFGSANKYAGIGALRSAAQLISYEIPIIVVALTIAMLVGSLDLTSISNYQTTIPFVLIQPLGMVIFFLAGVAEAGRTPFDIFHAESEVMGGPFVEYSGAHWAIFYLTEYMNTFLIAALITLLFLGGWHGPWLPAVLWFLIKIYAVILVMFWFRGTLPRLRVDHLMSLGWKVFVPLSLVNFVVTAFWLYYGWPLWSLGLTGLLLLLVLATIASLKFGHQNNKPTISLIPAREVRNV